ncbi:MAG: hypothetical protein KGL39_53545 [Patescibacteria group bacterium]|nr:hypothetical protein [Patescibacteria group bacterium]
MNQKLNMSTINEHVENLQAQFCKLSKSYRARLAKKANEFIYRNPGAADHSNFWRGLSARQVIAANYAASHLAKL